MARYEPYELREYLLRTIDTTPSAAFPQPPNISMNRVITSAKDIGETTISDFVFALGAGVL